MRIADLFRKNPEPAAYSPVPPSRVDRSWHRAAGDDSFVIRFDLENEGYVFKAPIRERDKDELRIEKELARRIGAPSCFGELENSIGQVYPVSLSQQLLLSLEIYQLVSRSPQIPEDEKVSILCGLMKEKVRSFMYVISEGLLADFDPVNVGIGEVKTSSNHSQAAVYLIDFAGAVKLERPQVTPKELIKVYKKLTPNEIDELEKSFREDIPFMSNSPLAIYHRIRQQDLAVVERLENLSQESKDTISGTVSEAYTEHEKEILRGKKLAIPFAGLVDKDLKLEPKDFYQIAEEVMKAAPQLQIKTLTFQV